MDSRGRIRCVNGKELAQGVTRVPLDQRTAVHPLEVAIRGAWDYLVGFSRNATGAISLVALQRERFRTVVVDDYRHDRVGTSIRGAPTCYYGCDFQSIRNKAIPPLPDGESHTPRLPNLKVTTVFPKHVRNAWRQLRVEYGLHRLHQKNVKAAQQYRGKTGQKLQLGCGPRLKEGWINVDLIPQADLMLDLREPLPFDTDSCSIVYAEHFLEHVDYPGPASELLKECARVLSPGGTISLAVPDIELVMKSYVNGGDDKYYDAQRRWHPDWCVTQAEHVNYNFRQDGQHRFAYDFETLARLVTECGFTDVKRREFDPELDSEDRITGSLYIEGRLPE